MESNTISELKKNLETLQKEYNLNLKKQQQLNIHYNLSKEHDKSKTTTIIKTIEDNKLCISDLYENIERIQDNITHCEKDKINELHKEEFIFSKEQERYQLKREHLKNKEQIIIENNSELLHLIKSNNEDMLNRIEEIKNIKKEQVFKKVKERSIIEKNIDKIKQEKKYKKKHMIYYNSNIISIDEQVAELNIEHSNNNERRSKANYIFYEIKDNINNIQSEIELESENINKLINNFNTTTTSRTDPLFEQCNEKTILDKIELLETLNKDLEASYNTPEYNLESFYTELDTTNTRILNEIDNLNSNKEQLMLILEKEKQQELNINKDKDRNQHYKTELTEQNNAFKKELKNIEIRLDKNYINIELIENENNETTEFYTILNHKEDNYDKNSHRRLKIATKRINEQSNTLQHTLETQLLEYQNKLVDVKNEINRLHMTKMNIELESTKSLLTKNKTIDELEYILKNIKNKITKYKKIIVKHK